VTAVDGRGESPEPTRAVSPGMSWATCSTPLRAWINATRSRIEDALGPAHVGTYLHGSLASGSFRTPKSDVDLIVVVEGSLDVPQRHQVARAAALMNSIRPIVGSLECSVVRRDALRRATHPLPCQVQFREELSDPILWGAIDLDHEVLDPDLTAHVQAICEFGVALSGPPVDEVFTPLPRSDFLDAILGDLAWILEGEHVLESPYYAILNAGRILWVLEDHSVRLAPSKEEAGEWMLGKVPADLRAVVGLALAAYRDEARVSEADRRTAGLEWPREALIDFRDWAHEEARAHGIPSSPSTDR
jgi:streptomycin 3"-adenylyltransferase